MERSLSRGGLSSGRERGGISPSRGWGTQPQPTVGNWEQPSADISTTSQGTLCSSFRVFLICSIVSGQKQASTTQAADTH